MISPRKLRVPPAVRDVRRRKIRVLFRVYGLRYITNKGHEVFGHWTGTLAGILEIFCGMDLRVPSSHRFTILC